MFCFIPYVFHDTFNDLGLNLRRKQINPNLIDFIIKRFVWKIHITDKLLPTKCLGMR